MIKQPTIGTPNYLVIQLGARRRYAVPALLNQAGMGGWLYTDHCAEVGLGKRLSTLPKSLQPAFIKRVLSRHVPVELIEKTTTFDLPALRHQFACRFAGHHQVRQVRAGRAYLEQLQKAMIRKGLGEWTHVYTMFGEGHEFLNFARKHGRTIVTEVFLSPLTHQIMQKLRQQHPDLETPFTSEFMAFGQERWERVKQLTDFFIVPSPFVAETLGLSTEEQHRCILVPYCTPPGWTSLKAEPEVGRILFVGSCELRKGIHLVADAAKALGNKSLQWRIAGGVTETIRHHERFRNLNFLGRVPRTSIHQEFAAADFFILPSYAEGSAEVIYEALALGLPVITTYESGSVVRHEKEGLIIPTGDVQALCEAVERLVTNREFRNQLSQNARKRALNFQWEQYGQRLTRACRTLVNDPAEID